MGKVSQFGTFNLRPSMMAATTKVTVTSHTGQCAMRASAKRLSSMKDLQPIFGYTPNLFAALPYRATIVCSPNVTRIVAADESAGSSAKARGQLIEQTLPTSSIGHKAHAYSMCRD